MFIISYTPNQPENDLVLKAVRWLRDEGMRAFAHGADTLPVTVMAVRSADTFLDALLANPHAIGIYHSPDRFTAESLALQARDAGLLNLLFVLLDPRFYKAAIANVLMAGVDQGQPTDIEPAELGAFLASMTLRMTRCKTNSISFGGIEIDLDTQAVFAKGNRLHMTGKEYSFLSLLATRPNALVTKLSIMEHLYGGRDEPEMKIVDVFACKIRKKLKGYGLGDLIVTEWGRGYALREPATENPD
jgi:DNA-binding winged helix-turn-helix (wHTH) protein